MNKFYTTIKCLGAAAGIFLFTGCESFFESDPSDFVAPETFYSNEKECTMALAGVYYTLVYDAVYGNNYSCMISNIDDLSYYARAGAQTSSHVYGNDHNTSNTNIWDTWEALYKGVNNANVLLENIDGADADEAVKARIKGEAKFLRAYFHFLLVQGWYEVPLRKESLTDVNDGSKEAVPHAEALDWIISEMEACVDLVDDSEYDRSPAHVKKNTVMGILSRVYLWRAGFPVNGGKADYEKAAAWAKKVYESGKHRLNPDVYAIWKNMASDRYDTEYNESMWEAEFVGSRDDGNYTLGRIGNVIGNLQALHSTAGAGYSYGFYAGSLVLWDLFDAADKRRDLSMAPYQINNKDAKVDWKKNQLVERRCGKFRREWEATFPKNKNWTPENYPILRYADVLLMLAEAENEANGAPTALAYACINEVRERAGVKKLSGLSYGDFQQEVRNERARELCFESLRKYDLVRWGIYVPAIREGLGAAVADSRWSKANTYTGAREFVSRTGEKHQFLPIPAKELAVNTKLEQNAYWK